MEKLGETERREREREISAGGRETTAVYWGGWSEVKFADLFCFLSCDAAVISISGGCVSRRQNIC